MFGGLNWIDSVIIILLIAAVAGSLRAGFFRLIFVITGFFGALFLGGWILPHILPVEDRTIKTLISVNILLLFASYAAAKGFDLGRRVHWSLGKGKFKWVESILGTVPGVAALLIAVWLLAAMVGRLPFAGFSNSASDALIVQVLNDKLPPVPAVLAVFNEQVNPNSQPRLFLEQPKPNDSFAFSASDVEHAEVKAFGSIVRITGFGCGEIMSGSGFAVAEGLVATNAHVIAGVKRPIVKHGGHSYEAVPVLFSPSLDFAVLRVTNTVHNFDATPLQLARESIAPGTTVAAVGYPGGNYTVTPGIIRNNLDVFGRNIYDLGVIGRNIYEVQADIGDGSSGGPIVLADGRVAGIVFAKYDTDNYAAALSAHHLQDAVRQAEGSHRHVSTGACLAE